MYYSQTRVVLEIPKLGDYERLYLLTGADVNEIRELFEGLTRIGWRTFKCPCRIPFYGSLKGSCNSLSVIIGLTFLDEWKRIMKSHESEQECEQLIRASCTHFAMYDLQARVIL